MILPSPVAQSLKCLTADPGFASKILAGYNTFVDVVKWEIFCSSNFCRKSWTEKNEISKILSKFDHLLIYLYTEQ